MKDIPLVSGTPGSQIAAQPRPVHQFLVTVTAATATQAAQVMAERILVDEDYGFPYTVNYGRLPSSAPNRPQSPNPSPSTLTESAPRRGTPLKTSRTPPNRQDKP